jgi:hypothetical protein
MRLPAIRGTIDRRLLVNYRVDPSVAARLVPRPFRPLLVNGHAIASICLIRLKHVRPAWLPFRLGIGSENAAHRFAVEWDAQGQRRTGVYIPRRDSSSQLNSLLGGRLVPGELNRAPFTVSERDDRLHVALAGSDRHASVTVDAVVREGLMDGSAFGSVAEASDFFRRGSAGYSATHDEGRFDGLELHCDQWTVRPLQVEAARSGYFEDPALFPHGSVTLDSALLMRDIEHQWLALSDVCCDTPASD